MSLATSNPQLDVNKILVVTKSAWEILRKLHDMDRQASVTELAASIPLNKSLVSRALDTLETLKDPKIIDVALQSREEGGRKSRQVTLTPKGYEFVHAIIKFSSEPAEGLKEPIAQDVSLVIRYIREGKTAEAKQAAWIELQRLSSRMRLWKLDEIWKLMDSAVFVDRPGNDFSDAIVVYENMLEKAFAEEGYSNPVTARTQKIHLTWLTKILETTDTQWMRYKPAVIKLFKYILNEEGLPQKYWSAWEKGVRKIADDAQYTLFAKPFYKLASDGLMGKSRASREKLYVLLEDPDPKVRARAWSMHSTLVSDGSRS